MEAREVIGYAGRAVRVMQRGREDRTLGRVATLHGVLGPLFHRMSVKAALGRGVASYGA